MKKVSTGRTFSLPQTQYNSLYCLEHVGVGVLRTSWAEIIINKKVETRKNTSEN